MHMMNVITARIHLYIKLLSDYTLIDEYIESIL